MTPQEYMRDYCKIAVRRLALYKKIFVKYQEKNAIPLKVTRLAGIHLQDYL